MGWFSPSENSTVAIQKQMKKEKKSSSNSREGSVLGLSIFSNGSILPRRG